MARVQTEAWQAITRLDYQVGEEIILLSEARDQQFTAGCSDAVKVASDFYSRGVLSATIAEQSPNIEAQGSNEVTTAEAIRFVGWSQVFDTYIEKTL